MRKYFCTPFLLLAMCCFVSQTATADQLYGINASDDGLLTYDPNTGQANFIGRFDIPGIFDAVTSFDIHPTNGAFYAWNNSGDGRGLMKVDRNTGAGTLIGPNLTPFGSMTFDSSGQLYGFGTTGTFRMYHAGLDGSISNTITLSQQVNIRGVDFDSNGVLYGIGSDAQSSFLNLYTIDHLTGQVLSSNSLQIDGVAGGLAFNESGQLYGFKFAGGNGSQVFEIDPTTGAVSNLTTVTGGFPAQGAAFTSAIPEPSAMIAVALVSVFGLVNRRRR